jgi:hypothetical protein
MQTHRRDTNATQSLIEEIRVSQQATDMIARYASATVAILLEAKVSRQGCPRDPTGLAAR